jgi:hypothetical protein
MTEARVRDAWSRTAAAMALVANCHRDPKKTRAYRPSDFRSHPTEPSQPIDAPISVLREVFLAGKPPGSGCPGAVTGGNA